ncbi:MAG: methyltransferase domain-containing protein [Bryobacteraceae bacterium]|jgi:SAM-dependent methyltransferase
MLVSPREGYRRWAPTYDESPNPMVALEARCVAEWLEHKPGQRLIDVGCGTGRRINSTGGIGIDFSREMLERTQAAGRIVQGDAIRLPFASGVADIVLCSLTLSYLFPARAAVNEMRRVARPGGLVIVTDVHPQAIQHGWKHSFRSGSLVYEIENRPYSLDDLPQDGLEETCDVFFGEPERPIFERAGKIDYFAEACRLPAIWMLKWRIR